MRKILGSLFLICLLSVVAFADGQIEVPLTSTDGQIGTPAAATDGQMGVPLTDAALALLLAAVASGVA
jgi:hypothetical protein